MSANTLPGKLNFSVTQASSVQAIGTSNPAVFAGTVAPPDIRSASQRVRSFSSSSGC